MLTPRTEIARERRRQIQIRKAFEAGLDAAAAWNGRDPATFYLACADYLLFSMERLHDQDQLIHDLLSERIPAEESQAHDRLGVLNDRQERSRRLLETFGRAAEALRASNGKAVPAFEAAAREFTAAFATLLQPRKNPFHRHTDQLFADADWERIAGVTPLSLAGENRLFARVQGSAPSGVDPDKFTAEHMPG